MMIDTENNQKEHFNKLIVEYEKHYDGKYSQIYRDKFMNKYLFKNINLKNKTVLEAMAGSGQTTSFLIQHGALVFGNDISNIAMERYKERWPQCKTICSSILETGLENDSFDIVVIVGGLHHLHPKANEATDEIYRILKKGGYFCFFEPHKGSIFDLVRVLWYKRDKYFESNEAAIDLEELKKYNTHRFNFVLEKHGGNIAYLLVLNSLIFRMPIFIKNFIAPFLFLMEYIIQVFQNKMLSCFAISQWQKK